MREALLSQDEQALLNELREHFKCVDLRFADHGWWALLPEENISSGWFGTAGDAIRRLYIRAMEGI